MISTFIQSIGSWILYQAMNSLLMQQFSLNVEQVGYSWSFYGLMNIVLTAATTGIYKRFPKHILAMAGLSLYICEIALNFTQNSALMYLIGVGLKQMGLNVLTTVLQSALATEVGQADAGRAQGIALTLEGLGRIFGTFSAGFIYSIGYQVFTVVDFLVLATAVLLVYNSLNRQAKSKQGKED